MGHDAARHPVDWLDPLLYTYFRTPRPDVPYAGDFRTVENERGRFDRQTPWETCLMMGTTWSWNPHGARLDAGQVLRELLYTVGGDGNFLLNVSPDPEGRIPGYQVDTLTHLGAWLARHGAGVYATRGGPWLPDEWGASTCRDGSAYIFVLDPAIASLHLALPAGLFPRLQLLGSDLSLPVAYRDGRAVLDLLPAAGPLPRIIVAEAELDWFQVASLQAGAG